MKNIEFSDLLSRQSNLLETDSEYREFVDKFKPKTTTDECYTPPEVYDIIADWCAETYGVSRENFVRPFHPDGDYEAEDYPDGCVVVDNPPFSILSQICRFYDAHGVRFFLFAPALTLFSTAAGTQTYIVADADIRYANGATIPTGFVTNLDDVYRVRTAPEIGERIAIVQKSDKRMPKIRFPDEVMNPNTKIRYIAHNGVTFGIPKKSCAFVRSVGEEGKQIFGAGFLLSHTQAARLEAARLEAARLEAAEVIKLTSRERAVVDYLETLEGDAS